MLQFSLFSVLNKKSVPHQSWIHPDTVTPSLPTPGLFSGSQSSEDRKPFHTVRRLNSSHPHSSWNEQLIHEISGIVALAREYEQPGNTPSSGLDKFLAKFLPQCLQSFRLKRSSGLLQFFYSVWNNLFEPPSVGTIFLITRKDRVIKNIFSTSFAAKVSE